MSVETPTRVERVAVLILLAVPVTACTPRQAPSGPQPLLIAHRGASREAPENTLAAFRLAWARGADGIEGDFHLTRDGHIVCVHDADTERTAGLKLSCADASLAELRLLDVGSWKSAQWRGERIPTLAEVLATVPDGKRIYIEIKCGPEILGALEREVLNSGLDPGQMAIISFNENVIAAVKQRLPAVAAYWLVAFKSGEERPAPPTAAQILASARRIAADGVGCQAHERIDADFVRALRGAGLEVHVWTVNEPDVARRFADLGVGSITTDRPGGLRKELGF